MNSTNVDYPQWMYWQNGVEFVLLILINLSAVNTAIIYAKHTLFHRNLVILVSNMYLGYVILVGELISFLMYKCNIYI